MEIVATFFLLLITYFLGCLSLVLLVMRPQSSMSQENNTGAWVPDHIKIILISFGISLATTILVSSLFVFEK